MGLGLNKKSAFSPVRGGKALFHILRQGQYPPAFSMVRDGCSKSF